MYVLAVDIGCSSMKFVGGVANRPGPDICVMTIDGITLERGGKISNVNIGEGVEVWVDGKQYKIGEKTHSMSGLEGPLNKDFTDSPDYMAFYYAALKLSRMERISKVVMGLPVALFQVEGKVEELMKMLTGLHEVAPGHSVEILSAEVVPSPIGSIMNILDSMPCEQEMFASETLVIDIGFSSVDWVYHSNLKVKHERSWSSALAMSHIIEKAVSLIREEHNYRMSCQKLEQAIKRGRKLIMLGSVKIDIDELFGRVISSVKPAILNHLNLSMLGKIEDLDNVVLTGGGARYYCEVVKEMFPHAYIWCPVDSVTANAKGFWRWGTEDLTP